MGRHVRFIGYRYDQDNADRFCKNLMKELNGKTFSNQPKGKLQCMASNSIKNNSNGTNIIAIEKEVIYGPSNLPNEVFCMEGQLEIKPSTLAEYINELYKHK